MHTSPDLQTVTSVDLARYLGTWYEIARLPIRHEPPDCTDVTAHYARSDDGTVEVRNRCVDADGKVHEALGVATPVDANNSRLEVSFLPAALRWIPFTRGDYWILRLAPDYRMSLVGTPDRRHLWLLARTPRPAQQEVEDFLATARARGFALQALIRTPHTGRADSAAA